MSQKALDRHNRWRSKTVGFRVTPEENALIDTFARLSGRTKQDYITECLLHHEVRVQGTVRLTRQLTERITALTEEMKRVKITGRLAPEFLMELQFLNQILSFAKED